MIIDLRSDTITQPTAAMREAMANAEVGNDVYGEDPTVNELEARTAKLMGKAAALFVPSGTMGNTIGVKLHTHHGEEVICDYRSHILNYELSMMAWFSGCQPRPIFSANGILEWKQIEREIRGTAAHYAPTGLIEIENTHNLGGGTVYPMDVLREIRDGAAQHGLPIHMDGARIFNASVYLDVAPSAIAENADTVSLCLSKALGAPVGSLLVGSREAIAQGRLLRKRLGGGMCRAGVLAAAALLALDHIPDLKRDHENAKRLARKLAGIPGGAIDPESVHTNIVLFDIEATGLEASELSARLKARGVLANGMGRTLMRMVTHRDVDERMCDDAVEAVRESLQKSHALAPGV